ncbi:MAG TPA: hypothetical protein DEH78_26865 [Solibacterales bacterium]|nr:hypothetical protein [Bryobacterales bacterium]
MEPPPGWLDRVAKFIEVFPSRLQEYEDLLTQNKIWKARLIGVGPLSAKDAIAMGVSGPSLRGSGVAYDVRKAFPYSRYEEFDFKLCTEQAGDCYARYLVRVAEMRESVKIIQQAMKKVPASGAIRTEAPGIVPPERERMKTEMEALIYHFKIVTEGYTVPAGEAYACVESPRGEIGYYAVSDGTSKPYRLHMRTPSFGNLQALATMIEGKLIADTIASMGSMDFVLGDVDR